MNKTTKKIKYTAKCSPSINGTLEEIELLGLLYFTPKQVHELIAIGGSATFVIMNHYVAMSFQPIPIMEDKWIASLTGKSKYSVERTRLKLTKAGWFKRTKTTIKKQKQITYLVGKQAVSSSHNACLQTTSSTNQIT